LAAFVERLMRHWSHCWISTLAKIGPGLTIGHVCGIIIPPDAVLGKNCHILQNSTIGGNFGKRDKDGNINPIIGDNVTIGAGAAVLGPITVGSNSIVGANATLTTSIPANSIAGAFRAEVTAERSIEGKIIHSDQRFTLSRRELFERITKLEEKIEELEKKLS
jgi:serine O-acetyltransferase